MSLFFQRAIAGLGVMAADAMDTMERMRPMDDHELEMSLRVIMTKHSEAPLEPDDNHLHREYESEKETEKGTEIATGPATGIAVVQNEVHEPPIAVVPLTEPPIEQNEPLTKPPIEQNGQHEPDYTDLGPLMDEIAGDWRVSFRADIRMRLLARRSHAAAGATATRDERGERDTAIPDGKESARPRRNSRVLFSPAPTIIKPSKHGKHKKSKKDKKSKKSKESKESKESQGSVGRIIQTAKNEN